MAVLGPGSGLGVACLIDHSERRVVIASEGGHATLTPICEQEDHIVAHLRERFGQFWPSAPFLVAAWKT